MNNLCTTMNNLPEQPKAALALDLNNPNNLNDLSLVHTFFSTPPVSANNHTFFSLLPNRLFRLFRLFRSSNGAVFGLNTLTQKVVQRLFISLSLELS